jgi:hypothetical protein
MVQVTPVSLECPQKNHENNASEYVYQKEKMTAELNVWSPLYAAEIH